MNIREYSMRYADSFMLHQHSRFNNEGNSSVFFIGTDFVIDQMFLPNGFCETKNTKASYIPCHNTLDSPNKHRNAMLMKKKTF